MEGLVSKLTPPPLRWRNHMAAVTHKLTLLIPLPKTAYGIALLDKDGKILTGAPIKDGWLPASGDKLVITYKPIYKDTE